VPDCIGCKIFGDAGPFTLREETLRNSMPALPVEIPQRNSSQIVHKHLDFVVVAEFLPVMPTYSRLYDNCMFLTFIVCCSGTTLRLLDGKLLCYHLLFLDCKYFTDFRFQ